MSAQVGKLESLMFAFVAILRYLMYFVDMIEYLVMDLRYDRKGD